MANQLSPELIAQLFAQESNEVLLTLVTLSHPNFGEIHLVNNTVDITSRGQVYTAFPMSVRYPVDDGESARDFQLEMDNVSLAVISQLRGVTDFINVTIELILASMPDTVQVSQSELQILTLQYNKSRITAKVVLDNFLNTAMTSEKYGPTNFPGLF